MQSKQKVQSAKPVKVSRWTMKNQGLRPGDKLPSHRCRLKKYPPLTKEQQKLVEEHRWIAGRLAYRAKSMTGGHTGCYTRDDLESVALFALCVAATRYDPSLGWKFSTFAWGTARGWIQHALRDFSRMVRVPRWVGGIREDVKELLNGGATYDEIGDELGLDFSQILMCEQSWQEIHSSYDYTPDEGRSKEFIYEIDEVKTMLGAEVFEKVGDLNDNDIKLMLLHVEGELESEEERQRADELLSRLKVMVKELSVLG